MAVRGRGSHSSSCQLCCSHPFQVEDHSCDSTKMLKTTVKRKKKLGVHVLTYCCQFWLRRSKYSRILRSSLSFNRLPSFVGLCTIFISRRDCRCTSAVATSSFSGRFVTDINVYDVVEVLCKLSSNQWLFVIFCSQNRFPIDTKSS